MDAAVWLVLAARKRQRRPRLLAPGVEAKHGKDLTCCRAASVGLLEGSRDGAAPALLETAVSEKQVLLSEKGWCILAIKALLKRISRHARSCPPVAADSREEAELAQQVLCWLQQGCPFAAQ